MTIRRTLSRALVGIAIGTLCGVASGCVLGGHRSAPQPSATSALPGGEHEGAAAYRSTPPIATGGGPASSMHPAPAPQPVR
jgi:hypothetical protein